MKTTFKRFLALLVTVCLVATALSVVAFATEADGNLFEDGSFEAVGTEGFKDYTSGWDFYWFAPLSNEGTMDSQAEFVIHDAANAHDGEYYIRNDKTGWYGIAEPSVELAKGEYELSVWVKAVEGTLRVNFTVDEGPAGCVLETDQDGTSVDVPEGDQWVQLKTRFTITEAGTYRVRLGMNSIGQETVEYHFDDFSLKAVQTDSGSSDSGSAQTADSTMIFAMTALMLVSGCLLVAMVKSKKYV